MRRFTLAFAGTLAVLLAGCAEKRDAASEPPIDLRGGQYSVTFGGSAFGVESPIPFENNDTPDRICVQYGEGNAWIYKAVRERLTKTPECQTVKSDRKGNAVSGSISCQLPSSEGGGIIALDYTGAISEDAIDLTGKIVPPEDIKADGMTADEEVQIRMMLKVLDVSINIRREGEC